MTDRLLIRGGRLLVPASRLDAKRDVLVEDGVVSAVGERLAAAGARVLEASGCLVLPGFIDLHAHFRDPGDGVEETIASGSRAAVRGGFTSVCVMPNTEPPLDNAAAVAYVLAAAGKAGLCRVLPVACATLGRAGGKPTEMRRLKRAGAVAVSDDGEPIAPAAMMRTVLECAGDAGVIVIDHPEEKSLSAGAVMHEGAVSDMLGIPGAPAEAEVIAVERDIALAGLTGGRLHLAHVSTAGAVEALRRCRQRGLAVTAEVAPHHLLLSDRLLERLDSKYKVNPPLRSDEHAAALLAALEAGVIDAIATDHAPQRAEETELDLLEAPSGFASIECAWPVLYTRLVLEGKLPLMRLVERLTLGPASVLGLSDIGTLAPGARADIAVIDPEASETIGEKPYASLSSNCPYAGWRVQGLVRWTISGGRVVYDRAG